MLVRGPRDVPALRTLLLEGWNLNGVFARTYPMTVDNLPNELVAYGSMAEVVAKDILTQRLTLSEAKLWWVAPEMVDVLAAAVTAIPGDVRVSELPDLGESGLVVFGKELMGIDANKPDHQVRVGALTWARGFMSPTPARPGPTPVLSMSAYRLFDQTHDPSLPAEGFWAFLGRSEWPDDDELQTPLTATLTKEQIASMEEDRRVIAALLTLVNQESITQTEYHPIERAERRRGERAGVERDANELRIITLRKAHRDVAEGEPAGESSRNYTHRWIVNPFYRWQRVGPGRQERRLTLVSGHVKGPSDKPLKVKTEVRAWVK